MSAQRIPYPESGQPIFLLSDALTQFRHRIEMEAGEPIEEIEVNAALFLSDFCRFLNLGSQQQHRVLGGQAVNYVSQTEETRIRLRHTH